MSRRHSKAMSQKEQTTENNTTVTRSFEVFVDSYYSYIHTVRTNTEYTLDDKIKMLKAFVSNIETLKKETQQEVKDFKTARKFKGGDF